MKNKYIPREIEAFFKRNVTSFPVVAVSGARQTGKTTMVRQVLGNYDFITLDDLNARNGAVSDPKFFVENLKDKTIIDEIQYAPDLLSYIKMRVDNNRDKRGLFVLTGSQQFLMMKGLTETLAGRIGIVNMHPFSVNETKKGNINTLKEFKKHAIFGSYPELVAGHNVDTGLWYNNYINTYIEKDVKSLFDIGHAADFSLFIKILALRTSQMLNMSSIASEVKVSVPTIKKWISVLEASGIVFLLQPYHRNLKKRLVKTPKLYFYDTATACRMCGLHDEKSLFDSPLFGAMFENFVVAEAAKYVHNMGLNASLSYIRTNLGLEVDIAAEAGGKYLLFEIKASKSVRSDSADKMKDAENTILPSGSVKNKTVITMNDSVGAVGKGSYYSGISGLYEKLKNTK